MEDENKNLGAMGDEPKPENDVNAVNETENIEGASQEASGEEVSEPVEVSAEEVSEPVGASAEEANEPVEASAEVEPTELEGQSFQDTEVMATPVEEVKKKGPVLKIIIAVVVICAVAGAIRAFASPEKQVLRAMANTCEQIAKRGDIIEDIIPNSLVTTLENSTNTGTSASVGITSLPDNTQLEGLGLALHVDADNVEKVANLDLGLTYKDTSVAKVSTYTDNEKLYVYMPALYDKMFTFNAENIMEQISKSPFGEGMEYDADEDFNLNVFPKEDEESIFKIENYDEAGKAFVEIWSNSYKTALANLDVSKNSGKTEVSMRDGSVKANAYSITIPGADVKAGMVQFLTEFKADEEIKAAILDYYKTQSIQYAAYGANAEDMTEQFYSDIDTMLENVNTINFNDITATVCVYKNVVVDFSIEMPMEVEGDILKLQLTGGLKGANSLEEAIDLRLRATDGEETVDTNVIYSDNFKKDGDNVVVNANVGLGSEDNLLNITLDENYNVGDKTLNGTIRATDGSTEELSMVWSGTFEADSASYKLDLDNIEFMSNETTVLGLKMNVENEPEGHTFEKPEAEEVEIFNIDEDTLNEIMSEIQSNMYGLLSKIEG